MTKERNIVAIAAPKRVRRSQLAALAPHTLHSRATLDLATCSAGRHGAGTHLGVDLVQLHCKRGGARSW